MFPILYSFRRCPYAIRARYALSLLNIKVEIREVVLRNKPEALLRLGGRSSVPQMICEQGVRYPESMDIIRWAMARKQNANIYSKPQEREIAAWLFQTDHRFKFWLDKYKYADRHPDFSQEYYRSQGERFLRRLESKLSKQAFLLGDEMSMADVLVFPFIRQFRGVDNTWFDQSQYTSVKLWLNQIIEDKTFEKVMIKLPPWQEVDEPRYFP
ncbi:glutathione S-transferase [Marinomonas sp. PE14-40]|uniref:glutathione S-transferase n=1 Tax=Marinomonas sp. PE14-40 TaxID=3060621 RepID=UPI003F670AA5